VRREHTYQTAGKLAILYGIEVRKFGAGLLVELWGELDVFCIDELKGTLADVSSRREPVVVDLSGISFLDLQSARELAVRSLLHENHLTLINPSHQVIATVEALGIGCRIKLLSATGQDLGPSLKSSELHAQEIDSLATSHGSYP
jgi:anti-anti-sigma regulatory factor